MIRVTGKLQRDNSVVHIVAEKIEDMSHLLDELVKDEKAP